MHGTYIKMLVAALFTSWVHQDVRTYDPQQTVTFVLIINLKFWQHHTENMINKNETRIV